ncbi:protein of unknown function [Devosia enhydra]|uniref:DUF4282 domain-containing protein n=1 Tax=Devosia enhydra TaxID=665118 RepID=A0A1K2HUP9_9HYPH|nr:DUF4282 domain-containing protein [Devosia enhydra]SFZ82212.1 protein of unknown function [Devosia enhydra]
MPIEDIKKILLSPALFRLDRRLAPSLVPLLYAVGLFGVLIWAVKHLFATFGENFGNGLWGLLEIITFGTLALIGLRILCEGVLAYFRMADDEGALEPEHRVPSTLLEDITDALEDIADVVDDEDDYITPATDPPPYASGRPGEPSSGAGARRPGYRRTARRTPAPRP